MNKCRKETKWMDKGEENANQKSLVYHKDCFKCLAHNQIHTQHTQTHTHTHTHTNLRIKGKTCV